MMSYTYIIIQVIKSHFSVCDIQVLQSISLHLIILVFHIYLHKAFSKKEKKSHHISNLEK